MTDKVYRVLSFKASLLLLASKPLNTHFKRPLCVKGAVTVGDWGIAYYTQTLNNSGSKLGGASRS